MDFDTAILKNEERITFALRSLYARFGYVQYKMSKFEEYELYMNNKDFLISSDIISFTDTNGRLMALKPDVTLSIVRASRPGPGLVQKVYYDENVYRISKSSRSFREIRQVGLECIGDVDDYCIGEVLTLACESLRMIWPDFPPGSSFPGRCPVISWQKRPPRARRSVCKDFTCPLEKSVFPTLERLARPVLLTGGSGLSDMSENV